MFVVAIIRNPPDHLVGYLSRFLGEIEPGVFVGKTSAKVASGLWSRIEVACNDTGSAILIESKNSTEQGFNIRTLGAADRRLVSFDGVQLMLRKGQIPGFSKQNT